MLAGAVSGADAQQLAGLQAQRRVLTIRWPRTEPQVAATARAQLARVESEIAVSASIWRAFAAGCACGEPTGNAAAVRLPEQSARDRESDLRRRDRHRVTFILAVLMPISIGDHAAVAAPTPEGEHRATADVIAPRLDRLEQAVDAIAIEVERIAEGQRFVTKVMAERPVWLPARSAPEPTEAHRALRRGEAVPRARRRSDRADSGRRATGSEAVDHAALIGR